MVQRYLQKTTNAGPVSGEAGPERGGGRQASVVSPWLLPAGHPLLLVLSGQEAAGGLVAVLLPDPDGVVLGDDSVVAGPLKKVALYRERM